MRRFIPPTIVTRKIARGCAFKALRDDTRIVLDGRDEDVLAEIARNALVREIGFLQSQGQSQLGTANYLAISGGGENGAFGAGLLTAWSALGTKMAHDLTPKF